LASYEFESDWIHKKIEENLFQMMNKTAHIMRDIWTNYAYNNSKGCSTIIFFFSSNMRKL